MVEVRLQPAACWASLLDPTNVHVGRSEPAKQHLPQTTPRHLMLPRIDKKRDDGLFAKRLGGLQPVQTLNKYEAGAVRPY
jgi:hypothetical protein